MLQYVGLNRRMATPSLRSRFLMLGGVFDVPKRREHLCQTTMGHGSIIKLPIHVDASFRGKRIRKRGLYLAKLNAAPSLICYQIGLQAPHPFANRSFDVRFVQV